MTSARNKTILRTITLLITIFSLSFPAYAQYSGGTGEPNDPYQIATAEDLMLLGESPGDYDKHFILTDNIDLNPNLPGRKVFDRAVIAPDVNDEEENFQGTAFTGVFDGDDHRIMNLNINYNKWPGADYLGLYGCVGEDGRVSNLGLEGGSVRGPSQKGGSRWVGGLAGQNHGRVLYCYYIGVVEGWDTIGGLVGWNDGGIINMSYSTASVSGWEHVGGLVGYNGGSIANCYSNGTVTGSIVGGLAGCNSGSVSNCYSTTDALFVNELHGGSITSSFFERENCDLYSPSQTRGLCLTTAEMQTASTFINAGWDFVGETVNGPNDVWKIVEGKTYPLLSWQKYGGGTGEPNVPYLIYTAEHLNDLGAEPNDYDKHFKLMADIDLSGYLYDRAVIAPDVNDDESGFDGTPFTGVFDGNDHIISNLTIEGESYLGLFGKLGSGAILSHLGMEAVDVHGDDYISGLVGWSENSSITNCHSTGSVTGDGAVGGLVGHSRGDDSSITNSYSTGLVTGGGSAGGLIGHLDDGNITASYSSGTVSGERGGVGGLVGWNEGYATITASYSTGSVTGGGSVGGLVGMSEYCSTITASYSTGAVAGNNGVGGLVGWNDGYISNSYSTGSVSGNDEVGGLVGYTHYLDRISLTSLSFWDMETSCQTTSTGGTGLTTAEMQTASTFTDVGWDFNEIWMICEGLDYPRLQWQNIQCGDH
jgi:hypothetical protein